MAHNRTKRQNTNNLFTMKFILGVTVSLLFVCLPQFGKCSPSGYEFGDPTFRVFQGSVVFASPSQIPGNVFSGGGGVPLQTLKPKATGGYNRTPATYLTTQPSRTTSQRQPDWRKRWWPETTSEFGGFNVTSVERGALYTPSYAMYFLNGDTPISPFHDIPIFANIRKRIFNMVVEVPRWTNAKMEIMTREPLNPIKQDTKNGRLRFVANRFPHHGYIWNYGAIPQTWEDPSHIDKYTGGKGDNDPIDVCEIGRRVAKRGDVLQVKVLGVIALIDEGETDWKLIAIDIMDPLAPLLNDIDDVEKHMPGYLKETIEWFRLYKIPHGSPANVIGFNGRPANRQFAHQVIASTHWAWRELITGSIPAGGINILSMRVSAAKHKATKEQALAFIRSTPAPAPPQPVNKQEVDTWHYLPQNVIASSAGASASSGRRPNAGK